ncbi:MAG: hypothetical protein Q8P12_04685 [bacterium]|nr:hypothetical protein [bacterium]
MRKEYMMTEQQLKFRGMDDQLRTQELERDRLTAPTLGDVPSPGVTEKK